MAETDPQSGHENRKARHRAKMRRLRARRADDLSGFKSEGSIHHYGVTVTIALGPGPCGTETSRNFYEK
jgi:hypothetical protein